MSSSEMMLADVIDYNQLVHSNRREAIFVVMDHNGLQMMDVICGVLPGVVFAAAGYRNSLQAMGAFTASVVMLVVLQL